ALLELPTDKPRPLTMGYLGERTTRRLGSAVSKSVTSLARREACTPFAVLLAAWQVVLYRYSGQQDIVVGVPVAGRTNHSLEDVVGCFVNTLPVRAELNGALSFRGHLAFTREKLVGALAHEELPFEHLVSELGLDRDLSRTPLFQVVFVQQEAPKRDF